MTSRPSWTHYFLSLASLVSTRSTCLRAHHGAVLVRDRMILATGYNGAPRGVAHCETCERERLGCLPGQRFEICKSSHAEMNVFAQAAKHGVRTEGATIYVTGPPCKLCSRIIINAGIVEVVYIDNGRYHPDDTGESILRDAGVRVNHG